MIVAVPMDGMCVGGEEPKTGPNTRGLYGCVRDLKFTTHGLERPVYVGGETRGLYKGGGTASGVAADVPCILMNGKPRGYCRIRIY